MKDWKPVKVIVYSSPSYLHIVDRWPRSMKDEYSFYADELPAIPGGNGVWLFTGEVSCLAGEVPRGRWRRPSPAERDKIMRGQKP